jgi:DNA repair exonuclease SbcCD ATPase subunit
MSENNYYNYYVETLTNTMTDAIIRNVSLQASVKVNEELVKEYDETIQLLDAEIGNLKQQLESELRDRNTSENSRVRELENQVLELNSELNVLRNMKKEVEDNKHQIQHVETFRKELLLSRKENEELKKEIEYLKLTPTKRKKVDELNSKQYVPTPEINTEESIKDGGSF